MSTPHIKLYIDAVSPFGYLGYWFVRNSPIFKSVTVEYIPILLGGLMKICGNIPPLQIKNKDKWIDQERLGWAKQFDVPMRKVVPPGFPVPTVTTQRVMTAIYLKDPSKVPVAFDTIAAAFWAPHTLPSSTPKPSNSSSPEYNINSVGDLALLLSQESVLGKAFTDEIIAAVGTAETKGALSKNTQAAFDDGAFGLPWLLCTNQQGETKGFFGFDHMGLVVKFMGLDDLDSIGGSRRMKPLL